ncbi:hypothetical protein V490_08201 [Pseudogymnoascus sp. VKM F-3557]|nr:hypothetical protein V490_08201 [Pseudogymnoascus sp. VKM F-3557]
MHNNPRSGSTIFDALRRDARSATRESTVHTHRRALAGSAKGRGYGRLSDVRRNRYVSHRVHNPRSPISMHSSAMCDPESGNLAAVHTHRHALALNEREGAMDGPLSGKLQEHGTPPEPDM